MSEISDVVGILRVELISVVNNADIAQAVFIAFSESL